MNQEIVSPEPNDSQRIELVDKTEPNFALKKNGLNIVLPIASVSLVVIPATTVMSGADISPLLFVSTAVVAAIGFTFSMASFSIPEMYTTISARHKNLFSTLKEVGLDTNNDYNKKIVKKRITATYTSSRRDLEDRSFTWIGFNSNTTSSKASFYNVSFSTSKKNLFAKKKTEMRARKFSFNTNIQKDKIDIINSLNVLENLLCTKGIEDLDKMTEINLRLHEFCLKLNVYLEIDTPNSEEDATILNYIQHSTNEFQNIMNPNSKGHYSLQTLDSNRLEGELSDFVPRKNLTEIKNLDLV